MAKINLSKGSKGAQVTELQTRLRGLGYYGGAVDGKFGKSTKTAVSAFQAAIGLKKTGKVNNALWDRIFADDAPTGTYVTLSQGMSGPAVAALQKALITLKLYDGAADGSFSKAFAQAVMRYQGGFGYAVTGKATAALQKDMLARADGDGRVRRRRLCAGDHRGAEAEWRRPRSPSTVRAKASTKGKAAGQAEEGRRGDGAVQGRQMDQGGVQQA